MATSEAWTAHIRALIYGIQFDKNPLDGVDRILRDVVLAGALSATPAQYLASIQRALAGNTPLAGLIPQGHSEEVIREFLAEMERRIQDLH